MRIFSYILGIIFILFGLVQFNDPDPWIWVTIYFLPALISIAYTHQKINRNVLLVLGALYLISGILLFPPSINEWISAEEEAKSIGMILPGIEEARESMGLFICFFAIAFYWIMVKRK